MICSKICVSCVPVLYGQLIDSLQINNDALIPCFRIVVLYVVCRLMSEIFLHLQEHFSVKFSQHLSYLTTTKAIMHLMELSHDFYLNFKSGGILQSVNLGARAISGFFFSFLFAVIPLMLECAFIFFGLSFYVSFNYLLILLILSICYVITSIKLTKLRVMLIRNVNEMDNQSDAVLIESLNNFEIIKQLCRTEYFSKKLRSLYGEKKNYIFKSSFRLAAIKILQSFILVLCLVVFIFHVITQLRNEALSIGDVVVIIGFLNQLFVPLQMLGLEQDQMQQCKVDIEGIFSILEQSPSVIDKENAKNLRTSHGAIEFKNVMFQYTKNKIILNNVSFSVDPNTLISIVGGIGAGKTSLVKLMLRFYNPSNGEILIDAQNIADCTQDSVRSSIAVVPQNIMLFDAPVLENLTCFDEKIDFSTAVKAAKLTGLHENIMNMADQYNTIVGERGAKLSGGEKQKIAFTRAVLANAKIIILDEPLNGLDQCSKIDIIEIIKKLKRNHTIIAISHEDTLPMISDSIIVLKSGRIISNSLSKE